MQISGHIVQHLKLEKGSLKTKILRMLSKLSTMEHNFTALSNKPWLSKTTRISSYLTSTLWEYHRHRSLLYKITKTREWVLLLFYTSIFSHSIKPLVISDNSLWYISQFIPFCNRISLRFRLSLLPPLNSKFLNLHHPLSNQLKSQSLKLHCELTELEVAWPHFKKIPFISCFAIIIQ